ncbi:MAG: hypothetical protein ACOX0A_04870 [Thermoguttaceae bacterium]|jgi:hypothetical protein
MTSGTRYRIAWLSLLLFALLVRVGVGIYWDETVFKLCDPGSHASDAQDGPFFYGDSDSYWKLGRALAFGRPYEFDDLRCWQIFRTPGYPALLAPLFWIFGENPPAIAARIEGAFFGMINVALVGLLAIIIFGNGKRGRLIAILAALFVALDPTEALQSVSILSEEPFMTFSLALNIVFVKIARSLGLLNARKLDSSVEITAPATKKFLALVALAAFFSAASIYLRPSWFYFVPFATFVLLLLRFMLDSLRRKVKDNPLWTKKGLLATLTVAALIHVVMLAFLAPWIIRNYRLSGKPIATTLQMGSSLYDGLSPEATGASDMTFVDRFRAEEIENPSDSLDVHFEIRLDRRMKEASLAWVKSHPLETARLACVKFYRLWAPVPRERSFAKPIWTLALIISYLPILCLGLLGLRRAFHFDNAAYFLVIPALYTSALHVVFVSSIRYRVPVMYGFAILAAYWIVTTATPLINKNSRSFSSQTSDDI